jgi:hypothetical protein
MKPIFGVEAAKRAQMKLPLLRALLERNWDRAMYKLKPHDGVTG